MTTPVETYASDVAVKPYEHTYEEYIAHLEADSLGPYGDLAGSVTPGLLAPRPVEKRGWL